MAEDSSPIDFFDHLLDSTFITLLVEETNRYVRNIDTLYYANMHVMLTTDTLQGE